MVKILMTDGSGFIGLLIVRLFLEKAYELEMFA